MRKLLVMCILCIYCSIYAIAQSSSFYCGNNKYLLTEKANRFVTISPKTECVNIKYAQAIDSVSDKNTTIRVYETNSKNSLVRSANDYAEQINGDNTIILPCYENQNGEELIPTDIVYLKLKNGSDINILNNILQKYDLEINDTISGMSLWYELRIVRFGGKTPNEITSVISQNENVALCYPSFIGGGPEISYDAYSEYQWGLYNSENKGIDISVSEAWNYSTGFDTKIAIVDCGVDIEHEDLAPNIWGFFDGEENRSLYRIHPWGNNDISHGTQCAGIASAVRNNGKYITGVAPDASLLTASVNFDSKNVPTQLRNSIWWAWRSVNADVISCSWFLSYSDSLVLKELRNAIQYGRNGKGCVVVTSAGNNGKYITFPGDSIPEIITVGNLMKDGYISEDSSIGENLFVCAPGTHILSTSPFNKTVYGSGTSFAAPYVAGVASLILSINPDLTYEEVRSIIALTAKKLPNYNFNIKKKYGSWNTYCGYGLVDAESAVKMALKRKYGVYYK